LPVYKGYARGFFTQELRVRGVRRGFAVHTLDGKTAVLARVEAGPGPRVGRDRVHVRALGEVGIVTAP